ncbi:MAG: hypothetical protein JNG86_00665 [Verrucomicrobiaceae bacterium]|nr:hypothetical protein [Verrucomicrobiaceae bacterium]
MNRFHSLLLSATILPFIVMAQGPGGRDGQREPVPAPPLPAVPLTPQQVDVITKQLAELEKQIQEMRGTTLTTVMAKLRTAASSDAAALSFYLDCEKLVNVERKDLDKSEERQRKEQMERNAERRTDKKSEDQEGDAGLATRLHIQYLLLTLEAHETKPADKDKLLPKLQAYIQEVTASAEKLKGRAGGLLGRDVGGSPIVEAYQIERFLGGQDWTTRPLDFGGMWELSIFPHFKEQKPDALAAQWDARINTEGTFRKGQMPEPEFLIWTQQELPVLKWTRAEYLLRSGPSPVNALKDMLDHVKAYPGHADAPKWLEAIRGILQSGAGSAQ